MHFVNETENNDKPPISGTFLFNNNGYMRMSIPNKSGLGDYILEKSWGYFGHRVLTFCNAEGNCQNSTLTTITPNLYLQESIHLPLGDVCLETAVRQTPIL